MPKFKLTNIETEEVSLVPKGANNKKFFLVKSENGDRVMSVLELLEEIISESSDGENEMEMDDKMSPEIKEVMMAAKKLLSKVKESVSDKEANQIFQKLMESLKGEYKMPNEEMKKETPESQEQGAQAPESSETKGENNEQIEKAHRENVELRKELVDLQKKFADAENARITKEFIEEARQYDCLAISPEEFGPILKSVKESAPKAYEKLCTVLKAANEAVKTSEVMKTQGSDTKIAGGSAWDKIEKMAEELIKKSTNPMSKDKAVDMVLKTSEGKALYNQYEMEIGGAQ